jgi:hypothetical protein
MYFMLRDGWQVQFVEDDLKTPLALRLTFADARKIVEMHERWGGDKRLEDVQALGYAIATGRGSIWLRLDQKQYDKLTKPKSHTASNRTSWRSAPFCTNKPANLFTDLPQPRSSHHRACF